VATKQLRQVGQKVAQNSRNIQDAYYATGMTDTIRVQAALVSMAKCSAEVLAARLWDHNKIQKGNSSCQLS
jgi:hypothetical protein